MLLLTASGILVAVLLVWAQLCTTTAQIYYEHNFILVTAAYGLIWVYYAVLASFLAFITTLISRSTKLMRVGLLFFVFSVIITIFEIGMTTYTTVYKTWNNPNGLLQPPSWSMLIKFLTTYSNWAHWIMLVGLPLFVFLICWLLIFIIPFTKNISDSLLDP